MVLRKKDYQAIFAFYGAPMPQQKSQWKPRADTLLSKKYCNCYNKLRGRFHGRAIGICTKSIYNYKGFTRKKPFQCRDERNVNYVPTSRRKSRRQRGLAPI